MGKCLRGTGEALVRESDNWDYYNTQKWKGLMQDFEPSDSELLHTLELELASLAEDCPAPDTPVPLREMNAFRDLLGRYNERVAALHAGGASGVRVCRLLSSGMDCFVRRAFRTCFAGESGSSVAVFALGGYGREELSPFSDIDLLFLLNGRVLESRDARISSLLRFLWDLNLDLGHSTRTAEECILAAEEDSLLATSLLESRFLAGNEALRREFEDRYAAWLRSGAGQRTAMRKIEERRLRIQSFNSTVQIQTPNIKESPGGLRDIHLARWLPALTGGDGQLGELADAGLLAAVEDTAYREDLDFLLRLRNGLHFVSGRKADLLHHLIIPEIAANLGYSGEGVVPVEMLMRDYYMRAGSVFRLTERSIGRFLERYSGEERQPLLILPMGIRSNSTHVALLSEEDRFLEDHPSLAVDIFTVAGACDLQLTEDSASLIERRMTVTDERFLTDPDVLTSFRELVNMRFGVASALRLMYEHGVLSRLIPEFGAISWHYQYDFYHAFTTDEHSLRVVENLERMAAGKFDAFPELHEVMADVTAKGALYLAGLLHDIGKAEGGSHSLHGERLATRALRRMEFDDRTIELVRFLIREHLLMSHVSQRRDMDDPDTIRDFIGKVRSTGRLRMLTALTFADLSALLEGALTDWKKSLLWSLYSRAFLLIEQGYEESSEISRDAAVDNMVNRLAGALPAETVRAHLAGLPGQYLRVTPPAQIRAHIEGIASAERSGAWAAFHRRKGLTYLTVICRDYPRALSDICGTITASDISIVAAQIFTRSDGIIIDTFLVVGGTGETTFSQESQRAFSENLPRVVSGGLLARDLIHSHVLRWRRRKRNVVFYPPRVRADNTISSRYTVLDVFATDYAGLLYDITSVLAARDIDIHTARIGTDEDQAADAFYIRKRGGGKIEDKGELEDLKREIMERVEQARG